MTDHSNDLEDQAKLTMLQIFLKYLEKTSPLMLLVHMLYIGTICFFLSVSYVAAFHWASVMELYREAHDISKFSNNFKTSVEADNQINDKLQKFLDTHDGMRAYIYRYHNGLAAISGVPFFFQSNTHEVISPGTSRLMSFEQRIPASIHIAMNNEFVNDMCYVIKDTTEDKSSQDYYFYTSRNAKAMVRCPIFLSNGDLFGFVGIDWNKAFDGKTVMDELHTMSKELGSIFAGEDRKYYR